MEWDERRREKGVGCVKSMVVHLLSQLLRKLRWKDFHQPRAHSKTQRKTEVALGESNKERESFSNTQSMSPYLPVNTSFSTHVATGNSAALWAISITGKHLQRCDLMENKGAHAINRASGGKGRPLWGWTQTGLHSPVPGQPGLWARPGLHWKMNLYFSPKLSGSLDSLAFVCCAAVWLDLQWQ